MTENAVGDPDWEAARAIWAAGKVDIPAQRDDAHIYLLSDLKRAAGMFIEAKRVTASDNERRWTPQVVARLCRQLSEALYQIDDVILPRMARVSHNIGSLLEETIGNLAQLEYALQMTPMPRKMRKRKHEIDEFLIIRLADTFERRTGRAPSVTTDWDTSERRGVFVDFVTEFVTRMLPKGSAQIDGRVIQRALQRRKKWAQSARQENQGSV